MATATSSRTNPNPLWRRWFRRTNVYIAEYILMLILMGALLGVLASLWYSFFGLLADSSYSAVATATTTAGMLASLLVVGPAAFWMYSRVTGQEMVEPSLHNRTSRTVFLTIWIVLVVMGLVGIVGSVVTELVNVTLNLSNDAWKSWVETILPGLLAAATVALALAAVVKHTSRKFVMKAAVVVAGLALLLLVANLVMVLMRKDIEKPADPVESTCTFSRYLESDCSYSDYLRDQTTRPSTPPSERGVPDASNFLNSLPRGLSR